MKNDAFSMLDLSPIAMLSYDEESLEIQYCNREGKRLIVLCEWMHENERKLKSSFVKEITPCFNAPFKVKMDKDYHFDFVLYGKKDTNARQCYLYIMDITFFEQECQKKVEHNRQYKTLLQNAPSAICLFKWDGKNIVPMIIGDELVKILGIPSDVLMQKNITDFFKVLHPEEMFSFSTEVRRALYETKSLKGIYKLLNQQTQTYQFIYIDAVCVPQPNGIMFITCAFTNVDSERQKSRALIEANAQIKLLYEHIPGAIVTFKFDKKLSLMHANEEFYSFLGYNTSSFQNLHGNKIANLLTEEEHQKLNEVIRSRIVNHSKRHISMELSLTMANQEKKWVSISGQVLEDDQGNPYCYFVFLDIDEYKQEYIKQAEENANAQKFIHTLPLCVLKINTDELIIDANAVALKTWEKQSLKNVHLNTLMTDASLSVIKHAEPMQTLSLELVLPNGNQKAKGYVMDSLNVKKSTYVVITQIG